MLLNNVDPLIVHEAGWTLQQVCHGMNIQAGWWNDLKTGELLTSTTFGGVTTHKVNVPEKLCLIHSEISEAMEGYRKNLIDDKLPNRKMIEVELADAVIRCFDLAGGIGLDLAGAITEKLIYNATREDNKVENRKLDGGKAF